MTSPNAMKNPKTSTIIKSVNPMIMNRNMLCRMFECSSFLMRKVRTPMARTKHPVCWAKNGPAPKTDTLDKFSIISGANNRLIPKKIHITVVSNKIGFACITISLYGDA